MGLDNDTRGWIMTCISGVACVLGASVICIDVFVRLFPGMKHFRVAESEGFLSASLSLSMGVMLFSALYSMLPQSKVYLQNGGYTPREASFMLVGLFLAGVIGIRVLSTVMHHFMPSHVVDCDHTHDEEISKEPEEEIYDHDHDDQHTHGVSVIKINDELEVRENDEETPLLSRTASISPPKQQQNPRLGSRKPSSENGFVTAPTSRRPSLMPKQLTTTLTRYVSGEKENCDENGPCMGFSDPCGQDCFKAVQRRGSLLPHQGHAARKATWRSTDMHTIPPVPESEEDVESNGDVSHDLTLTKTRTDPLVDSPHHARSRASTHHFHHPPRQHPDTSENSRRHSTHSHGHSHSGTKEHHHHVPTNAFMSIGLQTSLAIALHKAPEGFITYATNHANPTLGFAVFMALFIHNITEGFAMSLPLYLALGSRFKAIFWSSILGGLSQPMGAGVAALWFHLASKQKFGLGAPSEGVYGGMFAVTAGVMTSVALSLFSESLQLSHKKGMCIAFAFLGMAILGFSSALTAKEE